MALIDAADVERLFHGLVEVLAERDPGRLQVPFQVAELYQQLIPYRAYRARLGFDTNQDYEAAMLGLLAGLGGYATLEPREAQETLAAEAASPNPDPGLVHEFAGARVRLDTRKVSGLLERDSAYAPPDAAPPAPPAEAPGGPAGQGRPPVFQLERAGAPPPDGGSCGACGRPLPGDRVVVFCPWCGVAVGAAACVRCGDELEPEWRFCPRCGERQAS